MQYSDTELYYILQEHKWKYAKTMPQHPHEYTLREHWDDDLFLAVVKEMRKKGEWGKFFRVPIKYWTYTLGNYKYWTMGYGLDQTKLINRARI